MRAPYSQKTHVFNAVVQIRNILIGRQHLAPTSCATHPCANQILSSNNAETLPHIMGCGASSHENPSEPMPPSPFSAPKEVSTPVEMSRRFHRGTYSCRCREALQVRTVSHADMLAKMHAHPAAWWRICPKHGHHSGPSLIPQDGPPGTSSVSRAEISSIKTPQAIAISAPKEESNE